MENNKIGNLAVAVQDRPLTYKDKKSDLHTTMDFGSVMCGKCQRVIPGTKFSVGDRERVVLTSLVAPCFGRMSLRSYSYFVAMSDLYRNYGPMMSQTAVSRSGASPFVPSYLPCVDQSQLSMSVLFGSFMTIYSHDPVNGKVSLFTLDGSLFVDTPANALPALMQQALQDLGIVFNGNNYGFSGSATLDIYKLINPSSTSSIPIYLSNLYPSTFFDARTNHTDYQGPIDPVDLQEGYDYVVPVSVEYTSGSFRHYYLAFRLSSFGRRLRKNLIGCGWQFNISSVKRMSILPFLAFYKAYFEVFGLERFKSWEQTFAYRITQSADVTSSPVYTIFSNLNVSNLVLMFLLTEFGCTYYTDSQDFVSAHTRTTAISPSLTGLLTGIGEADVVAVPNINLNAVSPNDAANLSSYNGHAYIDGVSHGQLDSNVLKRLYLSTNVNTQAGRRIAELMRAQGLGKYMDEHPSRFIGSWELDLDVYDLPAQSDTYNKAADSGKLLGEMGAFGKSLGKHERVHYEAQEDGWFINLLVVVPKGGYAETCDPDIFCLTKYEQFNPQFDSLGEEFNSKDETVLGSIPWAQTGYEAPSSTDGQLTDSFGLAPRDFKRKFGRNVLNGDFSLHSTRNSYAGWNLERIISVNDHRIQSKTVDSVGTQTWNIVTLNKPSLVPIAGDAWRFLTRYEWLGRFNRIFYNSFSTFSGMSNLSDSVRTTMFEYFSLRDDNFIVHMIYDFDVYDQMLPVQLSFETTDDENKANTKMSKA